MQALLSSELFGGLLAAALFRMTHRREFVDEPGAPAPPHQERNCSMHGIVCKQHLIDRAGPKREMTAMMV